MPLQGSKQKKPCGIRVQLRILLLEYAAFYTYAC
jgi:hypothetical protein